MAPSVFHRSYAAGLLPITRHRGTTLFLVGKDVRDDVFSDFGGKSEREDRCDPPNTAVREFYEETLGCVVTQRNLRERLNVGNCIRLESKTQNNWPYIMFVCEIPFSAHLPDAFEKAVEFQRYKESFPRNVEKTELRWVTIDELFRMPKRHVFHMTIEMHAAVLRRIADRDVSWIDLCRTTAPATASLASPRWTRRPEDRWHEAR